MYTQPCFLFLLPIPSIRVICALTRQQNIVVKNINSEINPFYYICSRGKLLDLLSFNFLTLEEVYSTSLSH